MKKLLLIFAFLPMLVLSQPFPVNFVEDLVDQDLLPENTDFAYLETDSEGNIYYKKDDMLFSISPEDNSVTFKIDYEFQVMVELSAYFSSEADEIIWYEKTKLYTVTTYLIGNKTWDVFDWEENGIRAIIINCSNYEL